MKKMIKTAVFAGIIFSSAAYLSAEETTRPANAENTSVSSSADKKTDAACGLSSLLSLATYKNFASSHKYCAAATFVAVAWVSHKLMSNSCPWYRRMIGAEEECEEESKMPLMNARAF